MPAILAVVLVAVALLPGHLAAQARNDSATYPIRQALQELRAARDVATRLGVSLDTGRIHAKALTDQVQGIRGLASVNQPPADRLGAATEMAARAMDASYAFGLQSERARSHVGTLKDRLDDAISALEDVRASRAPIVAESGVWKRMDDALETNISTTLAGASLTLAGLLLGLAMPLLLGRIAPPGGPGNSAAEEVSHRAASMLTAVGQGAAIVLKAFLFFALAVIENLVADGSDWQTDRFRNEFGLCLDVGVEVTSLVAGLILLMRGVWILLTGVRHLAGVQASIQQAMTSELGTSPQEKLQPSVTS